MITPAQAEVEFWSNVESKVDAILVEAMSTPGDAETPIAMPLPHTRPSHILDKTFVPALAERYKAAGWRVDTQANGQMIFRRPLPPVVEPVAVEPANVDAPAATTEPAKSEPVAATQTVADPTQPASVTAK